MHNTLFQAFLIDMTQMLSIILWSAAGLVICLASGLIALKASPENIKQLEKLTRNKYIGLFLGWFALIACVPHAAAVSPAFLLKFLYPLALAVPVLGFFYIDYAASRAVSGTLILCSYNLVHLSFDINAPCAWLFAVCGWLTGAFAIWCSGLPWTWRDIFRKCAENKVFRNSFAGLFLFFAAVFAALIGAALL